ncbi:cation:dicarboxylate symporter family transporter [Pediococcus acidilactici]|nr:cation:dicarboxylase symporter family transporter [Pediococcus acidilactici]
MPAESIALFASIDWFVGMLRTVANMIGDVTTAVIIDHEEAG